MTDVFISYAHEDQSFVRRMVGSLEAEGFSVWWDHTIPPGQSWDTFIARGIKEAKAAVIVWSPTSSTSDWVKEEATLARAGAKYLPVQIGGAEPPMGFSRIQAAQLGDWTGDANHPQWQLLVREVRTLVGAASSGPSVAPTYRATPPAPPPSRKGPPWPIIGGVAGVIAVVLLALFVSPLLSGNSKPANEADLAPPYADAATTTPPGSLTTTAPTPERAAPTAPERQQTVTEHVSAPASIVGTWTSRLRSPTLQGGQWTNGNDWTFQSSGQMTERGFPALAEERWSQNGNQVTFYSAEINWTGYISADGATVTGTSNNGFEFVLTRQ